MAGRSSLLVWKREVRSYFLSPIAYIVIAVFLVVIGWIFFSPFFVNQRADLRDFFTVLPLVLAFVIPAVTMRLFAEEYRSGTFEITRTFPVSLTGLVWGKFGAALVFCVVLLLPTLAYPISISTVGNLDWGPALGGYLGAVLLCASFVSIGLFASAITRNQIIAYIIGLAICVFLAILDRMLALIPGNVAGVFRFLAVGTHFDNFSKGIIDTRDIVFFLSVAVVFLYVTLIVLTRRGNPKVRMGTSKLKVAAHVLFILFIVLANAGSTRVYGTADVTRNHVYSLSTTTKETVESLKQPITVRAFFSPDIPAVYQGVEQSLKDLLEEYARYNPSMFNYEFYSVPAEAESQTTQIVQESSLTKNQKLAHSYGVYPVQIQNVKSSQMSVQLAYLGVAFVYGDLSSAWDTVTSADQLEYHVTKEIRDLTDRSSALLSLPNNIQVGLYLSSSLTSVSHDFEAVPGFVEQSVAALNKDYFNRLTYKRFDPTQSRQDAQAAVKLGLPELHSDSAGKSPAAYAAVAVTLGDNTQIVNMLTQTYQGYQLIDQPTIQTQIQDAVNTLVGPPNTIGYLVGNNDPPYRGFQSAQTNPLVVPDMSNFYSVVSQEYKFKGFFLTDGEGIPSGLRTIMIVGPRQKLTDYELFEIDQFLMHGGSVMVFAEPFNMYNYNNQQLTYSPRDTGLGPFLAHYGIEFKQAELFDEKAYILQTKTPQGLAVNTPIYNAPLIDSSRINEKLPFLKGLDQIVDLNTAPLGIVKGAQKNATVEPLLTSSKLAWEIPVDQLSMANPAFSTPPSVSQRVQAPLAVLAEGNFTSYFANKPLPKPPAPQKSSSSGSSTGNNIAVSANEASESQSFIAQGHNGKLMVAGSSMFVSNSVFDENGESPNATFMLNLIDYMNGRVGLAEMRIKGPRIQPIYKTTALQRGLIKYVNIAGLPVFVIICGILVWIASGAWRRKIRRLYDTVPISAARHPKEKHS